MRLSLLIFPLWCVASFGAELQVRPIDAETIKNKKYDDAPLKISIICQGNTAIVGTLEDIVKDVKEFCSEIEYEVSETAKEDSSQDAVFLCYLSPKAKNQNRPFTLAIFISKDSIKVQSSAFGTPDGTTKPHNNQFSLDVLECICSRLLKSEKIKSVNAIPEMPKTETPRKPDSKQ